MRRRRTASVVGAAAQPAPTLRVAPAALHRRGAVAPVPALSRILDCAHASDALLSKIEKSLRVSASVKAPASFDFKLDGISPTSKSPLVIVVRSWEPPLAELADSIREAFTAEQRRNLFIAPIDWESNQQQGDHLIQPNVAHTQEWRRFCANGLGCTHLALFEAKA